MQVADFEAAPSKKRHPSYEDSLLSTTAPEYSTGEVLLAAAYRGLLLGISESDVDLENIGHARDLMPNAVGGTELWSRLLMEHGGIASPLRHGQYSPLASRQLMPIVPSVARIAGVLGKRPRSRWNPFNLFIEALGAGVGPDAGDLIITSLGTALEVGPTDDVWARFIEASMRQGMETILPRPAPQSPFKSFAFPEGRARAFRSNAAPRLRSPAERFCKDLPTVLATKPDLTRRQWTVLTEALLRLGLGMHVLWVCRVNRVVWEMLVRVLAGGAAPMAHDVEAAIWEPSDESHLLLELGSDGEVVIERLIERYAYARTGINLLLCRLDDANVPWPARSPIGFAQSTAAPTALASFLAHVATNRASVDATNAAEWLRGRLGQLFDDREELRALATCASGYTKNVFEFSRHSLGQVKAKNPEQRCYDLAYLLAYAGDRRPLRVQPGPAMLVTLVHACCADNPGIPMSLDDFRRHLGEYGIHVPAGELIEGQTGRDLAMLGLVVDSPDAAGGRLLVPPLS